MLKMNGVVILSAGLLVGCPGQSGATEPANAFDGALDSGRTVWGDGMAASDGLMIAPKARPVCDAATCEENADCCTDDGGCGLLGEVSVFAAACILAQPRGGSIAADCPQSPPFCGRSSYCQSFQGCRTSNGDCGFWVDHYMVGSASGELALQIRARLGCVPSSEFVQP